MQAFSMYGGLGISAPSLRRESTDSLIVVNINSLLHVKVDYRLYDSAHPHNFVVKQYLGT